MNGKDKCRILKDIRKQIALQNDIEWVVSECSHKGECRGTCPKCESEVRKLEKELQLRRRLGKAVAITGVSAACMAGLTACSAEDIIDTAVNAVNRFGNIITVTPDDPVDPGEPIELDGDVCIVPDIDDLSGYIPADDVQDVTDDIVVLEGEVPFEDIRE